MIEGKTVCLRSIELSNVDVPIEGSNNMKVRNLLGAARLGPMSRDEAEESGQERAEGQT